MKYNDTLQCFKNMFQATQAYEWMNDAHVHEMQVQLWKPNTWGVTLDVLKAALGIVYDGLQVVQAEGTSSLA